MEEKPKLKLGVVTAKDLAQWFGIATKTFTNRKQFYLDKLENFCEFQRNSRSITITKIYTDTYDKNLNSIIDKIYLESLENHNYLVSLTGMSKETGISVYQLRKSRNRLFGEKPTNIDKTCRGILGQRTMVWAVKLDGKPNYYRYMTQEEKELFNNLTKLHHNLLTPEQIQENQLILDYCVRNELSAKEYVDYLMDNDIDFFRNVLEEFYHIIHYRLVHATEHLVVEDFDLAANEEYRQYLLNEIQKIKEQIKEIQEKK